MEAQRQLFYAEYMTTCALAFETEKMDYTAPSNLYQHTLFYYDQAGNLIKTVAPQGRDRDFILATTHTQNDVNQARLNGTPRIVPDHKFITTYHYNSYNQLIKTTNPDQEGDTRFWYDFYGRIAASQNPHQADLNTYSYTLYDEIGRPVEVGQLHTTAVLTDAILKQNDKGLTFQLWVANNGTRTEVTRTQYDAPLDAAIEAKFANGQQENLRMRVASVMHYENYPTSALSYQSANHYSYDIHGNVKEVIQDFPFFGLPTQDISTQYEYELISGNMKKVSYQKEKIDQLTHQYKYDDLNRLVDVYSSTDDIHYHREASYSYFDYGPLARKEIGSARVQGQDFTYTLNGWLKGMNSNTLDKTKDPGKDGTVYPSGVFAARNERVAKDVVGFSLGYYGGDYSPIGGNPAEAAYAGTAFGNGADDLFNGNIRHMVTAIEGLAIQGYAYRYDQLQRIKHMQVYRASDVQSLFAWTNSSATDEYKTTFTYDRNGNLLSLNRNGIGSELDMDRFVYNYHTLGGQPSNRLNYVVDNGTDYSANDDIKSGQTTGNYTYNKIGELIEDASEDMELEWRTGDHKLLRVIRTDDASPNLTFIYNPFGQRIMKIAAERANGNPTGQQIFTFYSYDANGQVMAVYEINWQAETYTLKERHLYGAERLGVNSDEVVIYANNTFTPYTHKEEDVVHREESGHKRYELTNHLGNVLAVINDRKIYNSTDQNYEPVIVSWSDYYAFGMTMPGRNGNTGEYRYGYQGSEMDNEVKGNGNSYTTFFRQLDPRLGRWKSPDPVFQPHQSPYNSMDNNPVWFNDPLGDKIKFKGTAKQKRQLRRAFRAARKADAGFDAWYTRRKKEKTVNIMRIQGANPKVKTETFKNPRKVSQAEGGGSAIQDITIDDHGNEIGADGSPVEKHIGRGANESTYYFARLKKTTTKERISSYKAFFNGFASGYDNHRGIYEKELKLHSNDFVLLPGYARAAENDAVGNFSLNLNFSNTDGSDILNINHTYFSPPKNTSGYDPSFGRYTGISKTLLMKVSVKVTDREGVNSNGIFRNYNTIANFRIRVLSFKRKTSSSWGFFDVFRMNKIRLINLE